MSADGKPKLWFKFFFPVYYCFLASVNKWGTTSKSFIFSLVNKEGLAPFKSMCSESSYAIYRGSSYGPTFGRGYDIYIADNANQNTDSNTNFGVSYSLPNGVTYPSPILAGTYSFPPDDVEVFYLAWVPLSFLSPCTQKPPELKEKLHPQKITLKRIAKQRASKWLNILITLCFIHGFSLLIKLNGTHVRVRWSVTRSEAVCECRSFQSIFWTSKADAF